MKLYFFVDSVVEDFAFDDELESESFELLAADLSPSPLAFFSPLSAFFSFSSPSF